MAKRFGDTEIWKRQRWFRKLTPKYKLAFLYIKDQCDHAGIWNIDCTDLIEDLGIEDFDIQDFIEKCNTEFDKNNGSITIRERLRLLDKGYIWVIGFIQFQYKGKEGLVNPYALPVKSSLTLLKGYGLLNEALSKKWITLTEPLDEIQDYWVRAKDKEKEKDKEKDKDINTLHNHTLHNKVKIAGKNEKNSSDNHRALSENLFLRRISESESKVNRYGQKDN